MMDALHDVLEKTYELYIKAQNYHWNVEGPMFVQYHDFFGKLYQDAWMQVDVVAEQIRANEELVAFSGEKVAVVRGDANNMIEDLIIANVALKASLNTAFKEATTADNQGLIDYLAGRIDAHAKWGWQLAALIGKATKAKESVKEELDVVDINGYKIIKEGELYRGIINENNTVIKAHKGYDTVSELIDALS